MPSVSRWHPKSNLLRCTWSTSGSKTASAFCVSHSQAASRCQDDDAGNALDAVVNVRPQPSNDRLGTGPRRLRLTGRHDSRIDRRAAVAQQGFLGPHDQRRWGYSIALAASAAGRAQRALRCHCHPKPGTGGREESCWLGFRHPYPIPSRRPPFQVGVNGQANSN
jgi:hypothetical protein